MNAMNINGVNILLKRIMKYECNAKFVFILILATTKKKSYLDPQS